MIPKATSSVAPKASVLKLFTPLSPEALELLEFLPQATGVAVGRAIRYGKLRDKQYIDEAEAEAWAIASELFLEPGSLAAIKEKVPDPKERDRFLRATIGHELKQYFALRPTSTLTFLKKKGVEFKQVKLTEESLVTNTTELDERIAFEAVVKNELERRVCRLQSQGWDRERIAAEAGCSVRLVRKILNRIRKQLLHPSK